MKEELLATIMEEPFLTLVIGIPALVFIIAGYGRVILTALKTDAGALRILLILFIPFYAAYEGIRYDGAWYQSQILSKIWALLIVILTLAIIFLLIVAV